MFHHSCFSKSIENGYSLQKQNGPQARSTNFSFLEVPLTIHRSHWLYSCWLKHFYSMGKGSAYYQQFYRHCYLYSLIYWSCGIDCIEVYMYTSQTIYALLIFIKVEMGRNPWRHRNPWRQFQLGWLSPFYRFNSEAPNDVESLLFWDYSNWKAQKMLRKSYRFQCQNISIFSI